MRIKQFALFVSCVIILSGCTLFERADDVMISTSIDAVWTADENAEGHNIPYQHSETVTLASSPEIAMYASRIKSIEVTRVTYFIQNYNAAPHNSQVIFNNGIASFSAVGSSTPAVVVPYAATANGVNLQTTTTETDLDIDEEGLATLATLLKQDQELTMSSSGLLSVTPVSFTVVTRFYVSITANALD